tara:strand:+ start:1785 stop:2129 length:345 start_codon:yes stop_codon:yes gene_type:complete
MVEEYIPTEADEERAREVLRKAIARSKQAEQNQVEAEDAFRVLGDEASKGNDTTSPRARRVIDWARGRGDIDAFDIIKLNDKEREAAVVLLRHVSEFGVLAIFNYPSDDQPPWS